MATVKPNAKAERLQIGERTDDSRSILSRMSIRWCNRFCAVPVVG